jgi:hypothetical protein
VREAGGSPHVLVTMETPRPSSDPPRRASRPTTPPPRKLQMKLEQAPAGRPHSGPLPPQHVQRKVNRKVKFLERVAASQKASLAAAGAGVAKVRARARLCACVGGFVL